jgi:hypothetical protein
MYENYTRKDIKTSKSPILYPKAYNMNRFEENILLERILEARGEEQEFLKADGFDTAIIGLEESSGRLIYSVSKIIAILKEEEKMEESDAWEHYYYNIEGGYVGEYTPIWCYDYF